MHLRDVVQFASAEFPQWGFWCPLRPGKRAVFLVLVSGWVERILAFRAETALCSSPISFKACASLNLEPYRPALGHCTDKGSCSCRQPRKPLGACYFGDE